MKLKAVVYRDEWKHVFHGDDGSETCNEEAREIKVPVTPESINALITQISKEYPAELQNWVYRRFKLFADKAAATKEQNSWF